MFENLTYNISQAIKNLRGHGKISEINIAATIKEIRKALIQADVHYNIAKQITDSVKQKAIGNKVIESLSPGQVFTKIVCDELAELMGSEKSDIILTGKPSIILVVGLQGSGKTTLCGKLANYIKKQNKKVLLVACDVYRPAAIEQLKVLASNVEVDIYTDITSKNVIEISESALKYAKNLNSQVVIIDTAGRLAIDEAMMQEIENLKNYIKPSETLFVVDSMTGQDAVNTAKEFNTRINFDGIVLTKLDGDARGGAALSIRSVTNKPIKFISIGEKMMDLDVFHPDRMAKRILGMGDVLSIVEKVEELYNEKQAKILEKKIQKGQVDFDDMMDYLSKLSKLGTIKSIVSMLPGVKTLNQNEMEGMQKDSDANIKKTISVILSMTPYERKNPNKVLNTESIKIRISKGSGIPLQETKKILKNFDHMRSFIQKFKNDKSFARNIENMLHNGS